MFRIAHILFMITALLACPFNCLGHPACGGAVVGQELGCGCCQWAADADAATNSDLPQGDPSAPCDDCCQCGNCLCRGAILADNSSLSKIASGTLLFASLNDVIPGLAPVTGAFPVTHASPPLTLRAGRLLRFAIESLQV